AVKTVDLHVCERSGDLSQHFRPFGKSEKRRLFGVPKDRHDQPIEYLRAPFDQIKVTIGHRIKRSGIDSQYLFHEKMKSHFIPDQSQNRQKSTQRLPPNTKNCHSWAKL